ADDEWRGHRRPVGELRVLADRELEALVGPTASVEEAPLGCDLRRERALGRHMEQPVVQEGAEHAVESGGRSALAGVEADNVAERVAEPQHWERRSRVLRSPGRAGGEYRTHGRCDEGGSHHGPPPSGSLMAHLFPPSPDRLAGVDRSYCRGVMRGT